MADIILANALFARAGIPKKLLQAATPPSEYAHLEGLVDLLEELLGERDVEERSEIVHLLERVLGYRDLELVPHDTSDEVIHWVDARLHGRPRVSILFVETKESVFNTPTGAPPAELSRLLLSHLEECEIPFGLIGDGFRWRLYARDTFLPEIECLDVDLTQAIQNVDETAAVGGLSLLSAGAAEPGGIWEQLLEKEAAGRRQEAKRWAALLSASHSEAVPLAVWGELTGLSPKTPLCVALFKKKDSDQSALRRATSRSLAQLPSQPPQAKPEGQAKLWAAFVERLAKDFPSSTSASLASLLALAEGADQAAGAKVTAESLSSPAEMRRLLMRAGTADGPARILLSGLGSLSGALLVFYAEISRRALRGTPLPQAAKESAQSFFAIESNEAQAQALRRLITLACFALGTEAPYLAHHVRAGNPFASVAVSSLGRPPALRKSSRQEETGSARQLSFVEALFLERLKTLATDLTLLSTAGPERVQDFEKQDGIFRRLLRGVDRFRDLADLWLLMCLGERELKAGDYEGFVSNLRESDEAWEARLAPYRKSLERARKRLAPFHWELEFPELYVEKGGPRVDPGFHLVVLGTPQGTAKSELAALSTYHKLLAPAKMKPVLLQALAAFGGLFRTSRGTLLLGPAAPVELKGLLAQDARNARALESTKGKPLWVAWER